jgi:hypothetical protein
MKLDEDLSPKELAVLTTHLRRMRRSPAEAIAEAKAADERVLARLPKERRDEILADRAHAAGLTPEQQRAERALRDKARALEMLAEPDVAAVLADPKQVEKLSIAAKEQLVVVDGAAERLGD